MKVLITGIAGFIGFHLARRLLKSGHDVIGIDNVNDYYSVKLKRSRIHELSSILIHSSQIFQFLEFDISCHDLTFEAFSAYKPDVVVNLAAQAGVRYSLENPYAYIRSNIDGFLEVIEASKTFKVKNFIYASSSSVYGGNITMPFSENHSVDHPLSLYAATKKSNELIAHTYSHLFDLPTTGLRFFTVYGPWGRPDMALFLFTRAIVNGKPIKVYNNGKMTRDFTYVDDVVESLYRLSFKPATPDQSFNKHSPLSSSSWAPYRIFNVGKSSANNLLEYIEQLEIFLEKRAEKIMLPIQPGDVEKTLSDSQLLEEWVDFKPGVSIEDGIFQFVRWYNSYYTRN